MKKLVLFILCAMLNTALKGQSVLINEIDSDTPGVDRAEFVELFNAGNSAADLSGYTLVLFNGSNSKAYREFHLDGFVIEAGGYFLIGPSGINPDIVIKTSSWLQNGADAVALYNGGYVPTTPETTNLVDAVVYDTDDPDNAGLLVLLNDNEPQLNENGAHNKDHHSLQRIPNGSGGERNTSTFVPSVPTPGAVNESIDLISPKDGDEISNDKQVSITWTASGMDSIVIEGKKETETEWTNIVGHPVQASNGVYTLSIEDVEEGDYLLRISDKLNYQVADSSGQFHITDVVFAGLYDDYPFYPENGATGVPVDLPGNALTMYFKESVQAGIGKIYLKKVNGNILVGAFDVNDASQVQFEEDEVHIIMSKDLESGIKYYVEVENGAIKDNAEVPNLFTGFSGSGVWSFTTETATLVRAVKSSDVRVWPNPVTDEVRINSAKTVSRIQILNTIGYVVLDQQEMSGKVVISTSVMPKGLYVIKITFADGMVETEKLIKR